MGTPHTESSNMDSKQRTAGLWFAIDERYGTLGADISTFKTVPAIYSGCGLRPGNGADAKICEVSVGGHAFRFGGGKSDHTVRFDEAQANAAFIVQACNSHDALVQQRDELAEALKDVLDALVDSDPGIYTVNQSIVIDIARAALAKVKP